MTLNILYEVDLLPYDILKVFFCIFSWSVAHSSVDWGQKTLSVGVNLNFVEIESVTWITPATSW